MSGTSEWTPRERMIQGLVALLAHMDPRYRNSVRKFVKACAEVFSDVECGWPNLNQMSHETCRAGLLKEIGL